MHCLDVNGHALKKEIDRQHNETEREFARLRKEHEEETMSKMNRRKFAGAAAVAPLALAFAGGGPEVEVDGSKWKGVGRCEFSADVFLRDGFVPRRGDTIRMEIPAMTVLGSVTWVRTALERECIHHAYVRGPCTVEAHDFKGAHGPASVKIWINDVEQEGNFSEFYVTEAA